MASSRHSHICCENKVSKSLRHPKTYAILSSAARDILPVFSKRRYDASEMSALFAIPLCVRFISSLRSLTRLAMLKAVSA